MCNKCGAHKCALCISLIAFRYFHNIHLWNGCSSSYHYCLCIFWHIYHSELYTFVFFLLLFLLLGIPESNLESICIERIIFEQWAAIVTHFQHTKYFRQNRFLQSNIPFDKFEWKRKWNRFKFIDRHNLNHRFSSISLPISHISRTYNEWN